MSIDPQDLTGAAFVQDPYPYYRRLRASEAPLWLPPKPGTASSGMLFFSRYREAMAVFTCAQGMSKSIRRVRSDTTRTAFDMHMLHRDGPDHLRLRRLVSDWFSVKAMDPLRPMMGEVARNLVTPLLQKSEFDFVAEFAEPLPLSIIAQLIGVPAADMPQVRTWSLALCDGFDSLLADTVVLARQQRALNEFIAYVEGLLDAKEPRPESTLLGYLVRAGAAQLSREELVAMVGFLLFAGHENSVNLIANAVWLLLSHPQQWTLLREQPALLQSAIEEVLRFESPEQRSSFRVTDAALDIAGHQLEPGQQISVIIGSANRDEAVFDRAEVFDVRRSPNAHLAFGIGIHNCLGKTLARVETQVALQVLLELLPAPALCEQHPHWRRNSFFRGLGSLRMTAG